jgi:hypothetical protein
MEYKTYINGGKWIINKIENEIRKFCFVNDIKIITLEQRKNGWLMSTLYIDLDGNNSDLNMIENFLINLEIRLRNK